MDDGAVGAGAGDGVEGEVDQLGAVAAGSLGAERGEFVGGGDLVDVARRRCPVQPGEEAGDRGAVARVGAVGAGKFGRVLLRLGQARRVAALHDGAARRADRLRDRFRGRLRVEEHTRAGVAKGPQLLNQRRRFLDSGKVGEGGAHRVGELAAIDEQGRLTVRRQYGEG